MRSGVEAISGNLLATSYNNLSKETFESTSKPNRY